MAGCGSRLQTSVCPSPRAPGQPLPQLLSIVEDGLPLDTTEQLA